MKLDKILGSLKLSDLRYCSKSVLPKTAEQSGDHEKEILRILLHLLYLISKEKATQ